MMLATITRDELKAKIDRGDNFILVEAQSAEAYQKAHLPGAINPRQADTAEETMSEVMGWLPDKTADIVVYCASLT